MAEITKIKGEQPPRNSDLYTPVEGMKHIVVERLHENVGQGANPVEAYEDNGYQIADPRTSDRRRVKMVIPQAEYDAQLKKDMDLGRSRALGRTFDAGEGAKSQWDKTEELGTASLADQIAIGQQETGENQ